MKIIFKPQNSNDFFNTVRTRVEEYFQQRQLSKNANSVMVVKAIGLVFLHVLIYIGILSNPSLPLLFLLYGLLGITTGLLDINIAHDALHGAFSSNNKINRYLGYIFDFTGASSLVWKISHNQVHHVYTNIPGHDGDIDKAILLRLNPKDKLYSFHKFQNIYAFFLYSLVGINWIFYTDYIEFWKAHQKGKVTIKDIIIFFGFKVLYIFLMLVLPILVLQQPIWVPILGYLCLQATGGIMVAIIFQLAHIVENVSFPEPDEQGRMVENWAVHEMMTTADFSTRNVYLTHFVGGLNFQIEHHLFPNICHVHYPNIRPIVERTAKEFNLPYYENLTFFNALRSHYRKLKALGQGL